MSAPPERGVRVQVYLRQGRPVVRAVPATAEHPTSAQAASRAAFAAAAKISRAFTAEEVAKLVGGQVVEANGRKLILMPDGRLLLKQMAFVKWFMEGYRTGLAKPRPEPLWLRQLEAQRNLFYRLLYNARVYQAGLLPSREVPPIYSGIHLSPGGQSGRSEFPPSGKAVFPPGEPPR